MQEFGTLVSHGNTLT